MIGDEDALALCVVLWSAGSTQHLEDVQGGEFHPLALVGGVDLGALDDDSVGGQVHAPGQRGGGHQHLGMRGDSNF